MDLDKLIVSLEVILLDLLDFKYQGKNVSAFDTHPTTMIIFCAVFVTYGIFLTADQLPLPQQHANYAGFMAKVRLCSGSLALVLLLLILVPALGWFILALWVVCFLTAVSQWFYKILLYLLLLHTLTRVMHPGLFRQTNRLPV